MQAYGLAKRRKSGVAKRNKRPKGWWKAAAFDRRHIFCRSAVDKQAELFSIPIAKL